MGSPELISDDNIERPDGERWLELIGYGHLKGQPTGYEIDGKPVLAENFNVLCDEWVRPIFVGLENLDPTHPDYEASVAVVREKFDEKFRPGNEPIGN
jgi:hypothetical protein